MILATKRVKDEQRYGEGKAVFILITHMDLALLHPKTCYVPHKKILFDEF